MTTRTTTTVIPMAAGSSPQDDNKFGFGQRIESVKCLAAGALSGSLALAPVSFLHEGLLLQNLPVWEYDTDMAAIMGGLFAIVYRYCIREDSNPQLASGCTGAFILTRVLARISLPIDDNDGLTLCTALPLNCK